MNQLKKASLSLSPSFRQNGRNKKKKWDQKTAFYFVNCKIIKPPAKRKKEEEKKRKKLQTKIELGGFGTSSPPSDHYTTEAVIPKLRKIKQIW